MIDSLDEKRSIILNSALPHIVFDGWTDAILQKAAVESEIELTQLSILFPKGAVDAVALHSRMADNALVAEYGEDELFCKQPVPVKIRQLILARFKAASQDKEAVRQGLSLLSFPTHTATGTKLLYETVDTMWNLASDNATDFNWYTKRLTLAGVYIATLLLWLNDDCNSPNDTAAFLDRRLDNVKAFGKTKANLVKKFQNFFLRPSFTK